MEFDASLSPVKVPLPHEILCFFSQKYGTKSFKGHVQMGLYYSEKHNNIKWASRTADFFFTDESVKKQQNGQQPI